MKEYQKAILAQIDDEIFVAEKLVAENTAKNVKDIDLKYALTHLKSSRTNFLRGVRFLNYVQSKNKNV